MQKVRSSVKMPLANSFSHLYSKSAFLLSAGEIRIIFSPKCVSNRFPARDVTQRARPTRPTKWVHGIGVRTWLYAPESWGRYVYYRKLPQIIYLMYIIFLIYIIYYRYNIYLMATPSFHRPLWTFPSFPQNALRTTTSKTWRLEDGRCGAVRQQQGWEPSIPSEQRMYVYLISNI